MLAAATLSEEYHLDEEVVLYADEDLSAPSCSCRLAVVMMVLLVLAAGCRWRFMVSSFLCGALAGKSVAIYSTINRIEVLICLSTHNSITQ